MATQIKPTSILTGADSHRFAIINNFILKNRLLLLIVLSITFSSCAQTPEKEGLLWKISGNGLKQPSYLFGTFHGTYGIGAEFLDSIPGFYEAFNSVTQFVGESDMTNSEALDEYFTKYYGQRIMPADTTYEDLLNKTDYDYLDLTLRVSARMFMKDANKIRPNYLWFTIFQAKQSDYLQSVYDVSKKVIMDFFLQKLAHEKGYVVKGLDSPEIGLKSSELIYGNTSLPQSLQESADTLINNIKKADEIFKPERVNPIYVKCIRNFENAYKRQDLSGLERYKKEQIDIIKGNSSLSIINFDQGMTFLLKERSFAWIEKIPELISNQPTMIGVGAMHLCGQDGLINLLRQKGYKLEVVK